jgi:Xaa-Pro aminopeptidase
MTTGLPPQENPSFYAGNELHKVKRDKVRKVIEKYDMDALLLIKSEAVRYVTDFYVKGYRPFFEPEYFAVIPKGKEPVVGYASGSDTYRIQVKSDVRDYRKIPGQINKWVDELVKIFKEYGLTNGIVGVDFLPFNVQQAISKELPKIEFRDISNIWIELTAVKHPLEIELIERALELTEIGFHAAFKSVRPGVREYEVAADIEYHMRKNGNEMSPFITTVSSGYNSAIYERVATEKMIRDGEMVILDIGCVRKGYTGDLGRTVCTGKPTKEQKAIYRVNYDALQEAIKAVKPGVTCGDIDAAARKAIRDAGYEKYEHKCGTGHQLGYGLHGSPHINPNNPYVLEPGMVIALEPRVTMFDRPEIGGCHLEEVVLVTEDGNRLLSKLRFDHELLS